MKQDSPTLTEFLAHKRLSARVAANFGVTADARGCIHFAYRDRNGIDARPRIRKSTTTSHPTWWGNPKNAPMIAYGVHAIPRWQKAGAKELYLCEGESDVLTLYEYDIAALGIPGASNWKVLSLADVAWATRINVIDEGDTAGAKLVLGIAKHLRELRWVGELYVVRFDEPHKDANDVHRGSTGEEAFLATLRQARDGAELIESADEPGGEATRQSQATVAYELAIAQGVELVHDSNAIAYARIPIDAHVETHRISSREFSGFVRKLFYEEIQSTISGRSLGDALSQLEAKALYDGRSVTVELRFAARDHAIYIDRGDTQWQQFCITRDGYKVVSSSDSPVAFIRRPGMLSLPMPTTPDIGALRRLLNLKNESDFMLVVAWLVAAIRGWGPYAILFLLGEQGTAKSSTLSTLRDCIDPNSAVRRTAPRDERTLAVSASGNAVISYDNISRISADLSDAMCRLATGGSLSERKLYSDADEVLFTHKRPIVATAITEVARRGDLLDRAVTVYLEPISEESRLTEAEYSFAVEAARPQILAALLNGAVRALRTLDATRLEQRSLPRMADFVLWACAAAPAFGFTAEAFRLAYGDVMHDAHAQAIEASPVARPLLAFWSALEDQKWQGTAANLLSVLNERVDDRTRKDREWPSSPRGLGGALRRLAPYLREAHSLAIDFTKTGKNRDRIVSLWKVSRNNSPHSPNSPQPNSHKGLRADGCANLPSADADQQSAKPQNGQLFEAADGADDALQAERNDASEEYHATARATSAAEKPVSADDSWGDDASFGVPP